MRTENSPDIPDNLKDEMLRSVIEGHTLLEACAFAGVNPYEFAFARKKDKEFDHDIRTFQAFRVECMVDGLVNIHKKHKDAKMAAVISKNIQWLASKRFREIYGDKVDHNVNVQIDIRAAMVEAAQRVLYVEEHKPLIELNSVTDNISVIAAPMPPVPVEIVDDDDVDPMS